MKVQELYDLRKKIFEEIIKIEEVKEALEFNDQVYIYDIKEGTKHLIKTFTAPTQLHTIFLKENGFTKNAYIERLYVVDKKTKQCY